MKQYQEKNSIFHRAFVAEVTRSPSNGVAGVLPGFRIS